MGKMIYADNAATTKLDKDAFEAMIPWLTEDYGNASQPYSFARNPKKALLEARATISACINADPDEIFFTSGGTESDNWAIKGVALMSRDRKITITSTIEHHAILRACASIEEMGSPVAYLHPDTTGIVSPDTLKKIITAEAGLVSVMLANNEIGTIQPIEELAEVAHAHGALFHTDAVQAVGHIPIDVKKLGVDMLSASAHKFNGPKGVGFLYIRKGLDLPPLLNGGAQEKGKRAGTENVASIVGMSTALKNNCDSLQKNQEHIEKLSERLLRMLDEAGLEYCKNGGFHSLPGLLSLSFPNYDGEAILHRMDLMGVCISTGAACNSRDTEISHVLKAIGLEKRFAIGTIRLSLGKDNTEDDVIAIASALRRILS